MDCASCGRANRANARFCGGCGASLAPRCPACGSECESGALFCDACGAPLAARAGDTAEARKVVTIVFADLIGSTALHERLDAESTRAFMDRYYQAMRGAVEAEGGSVTQLLGDGVKAVFGAPRVAEDDAIRAVRAAVGMQRAFRALADAQREAVGQVGLRVAVNTGEVVADDKTEIIGDPVNVAARLQQEARDGDVLLGEATRRLVGEQVTLAPFGTFTSQGSRRAGVGLARGVARAAGRCRGGRLRGPRRGAAAHQRGLRGGGRGTGRAPGRRARLAGSRQVAPARRARPPARRPGDAAHGSLRRDRRRDLRADRRGPARAAGHRGRRRPRRAARRDRRARAGRRRRAHPHRRRCRRPAGRELRPHRRRPSSSSDACSPRSRPRGRWCC